MRFADHIRHCELFDLADVAHQLNDISESLNQGRDKIILKGRLRAFDINGHCLGYFDLTTGTASECEFVPQVRRD